MIEFSMFIILPNKERREEEFEMQHSVPDESISSWP